MGVDPEITQVQAVALVLSVAALVVAALRVRPERLALVVVAVGGVAALWTGSVVDAAITVAACTLALLVGAVLRQLGEHAATDGAASEVLGTEAGASVDPGPWTNPDGLTPRETEVLACLAMGRSNDEIAAELFVSVATVKTHINHLFAKAQLRDRAQAVAYAYDRGLVAPPTGGDRP